MNRRTVGSVWEERAAAFLQQKGMEIVARNFRTRSGEIDLIAKDGRYLVFVEVKYRADAQKGTALEAVDARKQQTIVRTARFFLARYGYREDTPCRFDVVGITGEELVHIENAFWA